MTRIRRVFKFGAVGVSVSGLGTILAGCSQDDSIRAILLFFIMLLMGGSGEEATTTEENTSSPPPTASSIAISAGNPALTGIPAAFSITFPTSQIIFDNPANETGSITSISFFIDSLSTLPFNLQVFSGTFQFATTGGGVLGGFAVTYEVVDVSPTLTITSATCTLNTLCTVALPQPLAINKDDNIGFAYPTSGTGGIAFGVEDLGSGPHTLVCLTSCLPVKGNTIIFDVTGSFRTAFGGTGSTP